jgi:hypothetical protein
VLREITSRGLCGLGCVCLLLQDLVQSCLRGGGGDMECVCVFITAGPSTKLCASGGGGDMG